MMRSFMTELTLFFAIILALSITFIAYTFLVYLSHTFHTLLNPPFPIIFENLNMDLLSTFQTKYIQLTDHL